MSKNYLSILYVLPGETIGGIATGLSGILKHMDTKQWNSVVAAPAGSAVLEFFRRSGIRTIALPQRHRQQQLDTMIRKQSFDLIFSCDSSTDGMLAAHRQHKPHIWYLGNNPDNFIHSYSPGDKKKLFQLLSTLSDRIVVQSQSLANQWKPLLARTDIQVIPWGITRYSSQTLRRKGWLKRRLKMRPEDPLIGMVGNFYAAKKHLDFVHAALKIIKRIPSAHFIIFGRKVGLSKNEKTVSNRYLQTLKKTIMTSGQAKRFHTTSFEPSDYAAWLGELDILMIPSKEGMGQAMLEACLCQTPVVAVNAGGVPEVLRHKHRAFFARLNDPSSLAKVTLSALKNPRLTKIFARRAREHVWKQYNARKQAGLFEKLYRVVLSP